MAHFKKTYYLHNEQHMISELISVHALKIHDFMNGYEIWRLGNFFIIWHMHKVKALKSVNLNFHHIHTPVA